MVMNNFEARIVRGVKESEGAYTFRVDAGTTQGLRYVGAAQTLLERGFIVLEQLQRDGVTWRPFDKTTCTAGRTSANDLWVSLRATNANA